MKRNSYMDHHHHHHHLHRLSSIVSMCVTMFKVLALILLYWCFSISLTFANRKLFRDYKFPLSITTVHMAFKFILAALIRWCLHRSSCCSCCSTSKGQHSERERIHFTWPIYWRKIAPTGVTASLDIALSNWSLEYITISLYIMCKSTVIVFILIFGIIFGLERFRYSLIAIVGLITFGLVLFTYHYTEFHAIGFALIMIASFLSGLRWTITQLITQKHELGLSNPIDAMYYVQPWMLAVIIPLAYFREGQHLIEDFHSLNKEAFVNAGYYATAVGSSALLAFGLEFSEFLLVSNTSSLTLSISGIFKEVVMLYLAVEYNNNQLNAINIIGLAICLSGIVLHCSLKVYALQKDQKNMCIDHVASERLLAHRIDSIDEWSLDGELNTRRSSLD